jgi:hypothetical protein
MLRDFVSKARIGASAELEAMTAERDFFREKYSEQMVVMEQLKGKLKDSQRVVDKLRRQILDAEVEKSRSVQHGEVGEAAKLIAGSIGRGSTNTSVTSHEDQSLRSGVHLNADRADPNERSTKVADGPVVRDNVALTSNLNDTDNERSATSEESSEAEKQADEESNSEDEEANKIRANAERMLQWAQYQTSKRSTPNASIVQEYTDGLDDESKSLRSCTRSKSLSESIVYSLPINFDKRQISLLDDDDNSTLGLDSTNHSERSVGTRDKSGTTPQGGKFGNLFNNLRDMIDPPSESDFDGESENDSTDCISR